MRASSRLLSVLLLVFCSPSRSDALTEKDLLFYAPFDGTLDAAIATGDAKPLKSPPLPQFVEGYRGKGLLVGGPDSDVTYATLGNLDMAAGAVAMWVKPVDWSKDSYGRFFFRVGEANDAGGPGEGNFVWLYKYTSYSLYWLTQHVLPQQIDYVVAPATADAGGKIAFDWTAGKWSHLIGAWSGGQMTLFIDGRWVNTFHLPTSRLLRTVGNAFYLGGQNQKGSGTADTVIDEVMILRQPLTPGEAKLLYEKGREAFRSESASNRAPLLQIEVGGWPSKHAVSLTHSLVGRRPDDLKGLSLSYEISNSKNTKLRLTGEIPVTDLKQSKFIDIERLPEGAYELHEKLREGKSSTVIAEAGSQLEKFPRAEWLGNHLGMLKDVPPPWTALERKSNTLSCWGRTYEWGGGVFPQQIKTQGKELLARPIGLSAVVDEKRCSAEKVRIKWNKVSPTRAEFTATGKLGDIPISLSGWMEYDGFVWCRLQVGSDKPGNHSISALALEIPLRSDMATLMQGRAPVPTPGKVCNFNGSLRAAPVIWLGNEKGGLQWSTEDTRDWFLESDKEMVKLTTGKDETVLRLTFIDHKIQIDHRLEYTVGLEATPIKPWNEDRRSWEMALAAPYWKGGKPKQWIFDGKDSFNCKYCGARPSACTCVSDEQRPAWQFYWPAWNIIGNQPDGPYGYQVASPYTFSGLGSYRSRNIQPWIYWHQSAIWSGDPVWKAYGGQWGGVFQESTTAHPAHPYNAPWISRDDSAARDYKLWRNWKLLKDNPVVAQGIRGFYLDCSQAGWSDSRTTRSGPSYNLFTILGTREEQKRFYEMLKEWPQLLVSNHQSGDIHASQLAFSDMMLTGEHLADIHRSELSRDLGYHNVLTFDGMRAEYIGSNFGIPMVFLPETGHTVEGDAVKMKKLYGPEGIPSSEHLLGMLWIHDVIPWAAYVNGDPFLQAARAKDAFGWDRDTRFTGYWENGHLVRMKADQSPVEISLFTRKDKVLFVVMNNSDAEAHVELTPNWDKLGVASPPASLVDSYAEQGNAEAPKVPVTNGATSFTVSACNFRALVAR